jgi:iron complex transport system permease protein
MKNKLIFLIITFLILIFIFFLSLSIGSVKLNFIQIIKTLFNKEKEQIYELIVLNIRLPRIIFSIFIGGLLAMSGAILQSILKNPLADPYITGISSGAALGATFGIIAGVNNIFLPAIAGAFLTILFVYKASLVYGKINTGSLLLIGVMTGTFLSSIIMLLSTVFNRDLVKVVFWLMGDLSNIEPIYVNLLVFFSLIIIIFVILFSNDLNIIATGEEEAKTLGVNTEFLKTYYFILSSLIVAICVSLSGIIGFVGLIIPHIIRYFIGSDNRFLLPASFILGGIFLLLSDTLARFLFLPIEIPVGIITGIIGAPIFIILILNRKNV